MSKLDDLQENLQTILIRAVEKGRDMVVDTLKKRIKSGRDEHGGLYGRYSASQARRRRKENLQTEYKDYHYSGSMFDNFDEVNRVSSENHARIDISFKGASKRRSDQKPASNLDVAKWVTEQQGKKIIQLSDAEKSKIIEAIKQQFEGDVEHISIT